MSTTEKSILLRPDVRILWPWWLLAWLVTGVVIALYVFFMVQWGVVILLLYGILYYLWHQKWKNISYTITDHDIQWIDENSRIRLPLSELDKVEIHHARIPFSPDIGHLVLTWRGKPYRLQALRNAQSLHDMIQKTVSYLKHQRNIPSAVVDMTRLPKPGSLENLNDLVGLWQQGLLSDEAFEQEKKRLM